MAEAEVLDRPGAGETKWSGEESHVPPGPGEVKWSGGSDDVPELPDDLSPDVAHADEVPPPAEPAARPKRAVPKYKAVKGQPKVGGKHPGAGLAVTYWVPGRTYGGDTLDATVGFLASPVIGRDGKLGTGEVWNMYVLSMGRFDFRAAVEYSATPKAGHWSWPAAGVTHAVRDGDE